MKYKLSIVILLFFSISAFSQNSQGDFLERVYFGGGFGLSGGSGFFNVSASPLIGYKITPRLSAGASVIIQYSQYTNFNLDLLNYGGSLFTRYIIFRNIFATLEYEYLTFEYPTNNSFSETSREGFSSLFLGGGFVQPISRNASFSIIALYNLLYDQNRTNSPYQSPFVIRAGFNVGF